MIEIIRSDCGIKISGHAGYAEPGKDIVCAGVSTLVQTLIQSIEELTEDKIEYSIHHGMAEIKYRNLSEAGKLLTGSFFVGVRMIAGEYQDYVRLVE